MHTEHVTGTIIIKGSAKDMYSLWSHYELFPQFIDGICLVSRPDDRTSHWEIQTVMGRKIRSTAVVTEFQEDKRISWESSGKELKTSGYVTFTSLLNNETELTIYIEYSHIFGFWGELALEIFDEPQEKLEKALEEFKEYAEGTLPLVNKEELIFDGILQKI